MTFVVIRADRSLVVDDQPPTLDLVEAIVGPEGWAPIRLAREYGVIGWMNEHALIATAGDGSPAYPRNPVASCVLVTMRGPQQPYAGDVVLTGYDYGSDGGWPEDLPHNSLQAVQDIHAAVRRVLDGQAAGVTWARRSWPREIRAFGAAVAAGAPLPIVLM